MLPPDTPPFGGSDAEMATRWAEYRERYDRMLVLTERSLDVQEQCNQHLQNELRAREYSLKLQEQQQVHARKAVRWLLCGLAVFFGGLLVFVTIKELVKAAG